MPNLTQQQWKILHESGFLNVYPAVRDELLTYLDDVATPESNISEIAHVLIYGYKDDRRLGPIMAYASQSGVSLSDILQAAGLFLGDEYLKHNPHIQ